MKNLNIGDKIVAGAAFDRKCTRRFDDKNSLKPITRNFTGFIVGKRNVIMSNFTYHSGGVWDGEYGPPYVSGKTEWVWLVSESIKHEPLIVRDCDILEVKARVIL
jgi:hypothetical protein